MGSAPIDQIPVHGQNGHCNGVCDDESLSDELVTRYTNCHILSNGKLIKEDLWVRRGRFIDPQRLFYDERKTADRIINCHGAIISPGFIELQLNGRNHISSLV